MTFRPTIGLREDDGPTGEWSCPSSPTLLHMERQSFAHARFIAGDSPIETGARGLPAFYATVDLETDEPVLVDLSPDGAWSAQRDAWLTQVCGLTHPRVAPLRGLVALDEGRAVIRAVPEGQRLDLCARSLSSTVGLQGAVDIVETVQTFRAAGLLGGAPSPERIWVQRDGRFMIGMPAVFVADGDLSRDREPLERVLKLALGRRRLPGPVQSALEDGRDLSGLLDALRLVRETAEKRPTQGRRVLIGLLGAAMLVIGLIGAMRWRAPRPALEPTAPEWAVTASDAAPSLAPLPAPAATDRTAPAAARQGSPPDGHTRALGKDATVEPGRDPIEGHPPTGQSVDAGPFRGDEHAPLRARARDAKTSEEWTTVMRELHDQDSRDAAAAFVGRRRRVVWIAPMVAEPDSDTSAPEEVR